MAGSDERSGPLARLRARHVSDAVRVVLGILVVVLAALPVRPDAVGRIETGAFDVVNGLPDGLFWVLWLPMQLGSLVAVVLVAGAALLLRRWWLAVESAVAGTAAWTVAKVVKDGFGRPRPGGLLDDVVFRGGEPVGFGFLSGHSAVAFALATAASLYLPRRWRARAFALAAVVGLSRVFVGAHLPLDVIAGSALGWAIAAALRLVVGAATGRPTTEQVRDGLARLGIAAAEVVPLDTASRTSAVYRVEGTSRGTLFAKVLSDRPQDRDALHRWWLRLTRRVARGTQRFASPRLQVEFEAGRTSAAAAAGVRVPTVVYAGPLDADHAVLITSWVPGAPIDPAVDAVAEQDARAQVERLHAAGIAHGDLVAENVLAAGGEVTLVDFGEARLLADPEALHHDRATLSAALGQRTAR
jgi:membrane-associated phospholipid phosphatase/tRNA A-37 threonylcarbamoyl transferase component Bud32